MSSTHINNTENDSWGEYVMNARQEIYIAIGPEIVSILSYIFKLKCTSAQTQHQSSAYINPNLQPSF